MVATKGRCFRVFGVAVLLCAGTVFCGTTCQAAGEAAASAQFDVARTLPENLQTFKGKAVTVMLLSGQSVTGVVKEVKNGLLHLEKLSQKDFFDAMIVVDKIGSVEAKVR